MKQPVTPLKKPRINRWGFFLDVPGMPVYGLLLIASKLLRANVARLHTYIRPL